MKAISILLLWLWVDPGSAALDDWSVIRDKKPSAVEIMKQFVILIKILKVKFEYVTEHVTGVWYLKQNQGWNILAKKIQFSIQSL